MSEATDAIADLIDALDEFGTSITLNKITKTGAYVPATGAYATTTVATTKKAFIKQFASEKLVNNPLVKVSGYDVVFKLNHDEAITTDWTIVYNSDAYKILLVDTSILQNEDILYECVCKK